MVLDKHRDKVHPLLYPMARKLSRFSPNLLTYLSLICAIAGAYTFYRGGGLLLIAGAFIGLNGLLDALDGKVARITRKESKKGDFLDDTIDRYSDILILCGILFSAYANKFIGMLALIGVLLTSHNGITARACGVEKTFDGLGRADRMLILTATPVVQYILLRMNISLIYGLWFVGWVLVFFAVMSNLSAVVRFLHAWFALGKVIKR